jgi:hypothetical protein
VSDSVLFLEFRFFCTHSINSIPINSVIECPCKVIIKEVYTFKYFLERINWPIKLSIGTLIQKALYIYVVYPKVPEI